MGRYFEQWTLILIFLTGSVAKAALTPIQRDHLRYRLENLWNEVDLAVRNHRADERDLKRQEREIVNFQVYDKFPVAKAAAGQKADPFRTIRQKIALSLPKFGLKLGSMRLLSESKMRSPPPKRIYTDQRDFHLSEDQLLSRVRIDFTVQGPEASLRNWMRAWREVTPPEEAREAIRDHQPAHADSPYLEPAQVEKRGSSGWRIRATAFCFRDLEFPKLSPRDPLELLPGWARRNPEAFKRQEPLLWSFVERTRKRLPEARPLYGIREKFLLNDARLSFYIKKFLAR